MFFRCCASLVLALAVSGCGSSSAGTPFEGGSQATSAASRGGSSRLIVRAQLVEFSGRSAWDAVDILNQRWLRPQRGASNSGRPVFPRIVVDGTVRGELDDLFRLRADNIETMRLLTSSDATTKYGTGYFGGVIEVTTIRGR
jgi:hypothetical protein